MLKDRECMARYEESMAAHEASQSTGVVPNAFDTDGKMPTRKEMHSLQMALSQMPQISLKAKHRFAGGVYLRELEIPAGNVVLGKIHKHEHFVILAEGACRINTDEGMQDIVAPHVWISKAGDQRALYTYEHCTFLTVHENTADIRDIDELEDSLVENDLNSIKYIGEL